MKKIFAVLIVAFSSSGAFAEMAKYQEVGSTEPAAAVSSPSVVAAPDAQFEVVGSTLEVAASTLASVAVSTGTSLVSKLYSATGGLLDRWDKEVSNNKGLGLQIGARVGTLNGLDTTSQPTGFQTESSDQSGASLGLSLQMKWKRFALEWVPLDNSRDLDTKYYGSSLGRIKVITSNLFIGKVFPIDKEKYSVSVGLGAEYTKLEGDVSLGGFKFPTKGGGWSPVFQIGGQYHLSTHWSMGVDYERGNVRIVTSIPGAPDLVSTYTDRMSARLMCRVW